MSQQIASPPTIEEFQELQKQLALKDAFIVKLLARLEELERRLGLNSTTSSKPPSSDGFRKPTPVSLRVKGQKPSGGQLGHRGGTLKQAEQADQVVIHQAQQCSGCGADLSQVTGSQTSVRQVFDLIMAPVCVTEHQVYAKQCLCGHSSYGQFPAQVRAPVQYGPGIQALAVYLQHQHMLPQDRLEVLFADLFNLSISATTLSNMAQRFAAQVNPTVQAIYEKLRTADVKNMDETGLRVNERLNWLHVLSNKDWTHYRVDPKRGAVPQDLQGTVVHDHFKRYYTLSGLTHALCGAHHLRELKGLELIEKESWAKAMGKLLRLACHWAKQGPVAQEQADRISVVYDRLISKGLAYHEALPGLGEKPRRGRIKRRVGHNLLRRLRDYKADALRFLFEENVPFTNNQAEQDVRMMKVKQKISGCFRSEEGQKTFATARSYLSTARKQAVNLFEAILNPQQQPFYAASPACA